MFLERASPAAYGDIGSLRRPEPACHAASRPCYVEQPVPPLTPTHQEMFLFHVSTREEEVTSKSMNKAHCMQAWHTHGVR